MFLTGITDVSMQLFRGCTGLEKIIFPPNITWINHSCLRSTSIESIVIPKKVKELWQSIFEQCSKLKIVIFEDGCPELMTMRYAIFRDCASLEEIELPDTIIAIGAHNFAGCTSLKRCHYPTNPAIKEIPINEFSDCSALQEIPMTPYITSIGDSSFSGCSSLTGHLNLSQIKNLGDYSFRYCVGIESINLEGLIALGTGLFMECTSLKTVKLNTRLNSIGNSCFKNSGIESIDLSNYAGIVLGNSVFQDCKMLKEVNLPSNVTFGGYTFTNSGLEGDVIVQKGTIINGGQHFSGTNITSIVFAEGQTSIPFGIANYCLLLESITLPSTVADIGSAPFHGDVKLGWVICKALLPPVMANNFGHITSAWKLYVPDESVSVYKTATNWSQYASRIYPLSSKPE